MSFNNFDSRIGKEFCSFLLVGTIVGCVVCGPIADARDISEGKIPYINELDLGFYTDEDVKANRERLFASIAEGGSEKAKSYSKKNNKVVVPKKITK